MHLRVTAAGILMFLLASGAPAVAQDGDAGQIGSTARIGQGARGMAMGSAFTAIADDETGIYYNPAGVVQVREPILGFAWRVMPFMDRKQGYFNAAVPLRDGASMGFSWVYSGVGDIAERNSQGVAGDVFAFHENLLTLSFAKIFGDVIAVGGAMHFVNQTLFDVAANAVGLSAGLHLRFDRKQRRPFPDALQRLTVGLAMQYAGLTLRFDSKDYYEPRGIGNGTISAEEFPLVVRGGLAYRLLSGRTLLLSAEGTWVEDQHLRGYFGAEWSVERRLMLRAGMAQTDPTFGLGLRQTWGKILLGLDYAFITSPVGEDPDHILSLSVAF